MSEPTTDDFDNALAAILDEAPASHLLSIPGVYEILAEHFNNDVLRALEDEAAEDEAAEDESDDDEEPAK